MSDTQPPKNRGVRFTSDRNGVRVEEVEYTDAEIAALEKKEMGLRLALVEADETLQQMPSTPGEFARWFLEQEDGGV